MGKKVSTSGKSKKDEKLEELKRQQRQIPFEERQLQIESFVKKSDEFAKDEAAKRKERSRIKKWFINLSDNEIDFLFSNIIEKYESKFKKSWFYRLADLFGVEKKLMDVYVKPDFVRLFIIQFVYARFPQRVLFRLRSRNRKARKDGVNDTKLFQHLSKDASEQLDIVIKQVFVMMGEYDNVKDFSRAYGAEYKVWYQTEMFS